MIMIAQYGGSMRIQFNAPTILTFTLAAFLIHFLNTFMFGLTSEFFVVRGTMSLSNPWDYFRLISHSLGHGNWNHLISNFTFILLLGPLLEEKWGTFPLFFMMCVTALCTGVLNVLLFDTGLLGASGIVFLFILLSSVVNLKQGKIPLTFILVASIYIGSEIKNSLQLDSISQMAHIVGGICGSLFGFAFSKKHS